MSALATVSELAVLLKTNVDSGDPYAKMMLEQASTLVRDHALQPGWVLALSDPAVLGEILAPGAAHDITLWAAQRAYTNPRNLSRRTAGPISESFFENGIYGLELTDGEKARIDALPGVNKPTKSGVWVQPIDAGYRGLTHTKVTVPSSMNPPGDLFYIADSNQYPYGNV